MASHGRKRLKRRQNVQKSSPSYLEGVHVDFERLADWVSLDTLEDYRDLAQRYLDRYLPSSCPTSEVPPGTSEVFFPLALPR